jgi:hypothetical protein
MNKDDPKKAEGGQYREDLEAMAELLLDIYLDRTLRRQEKNDAVSRS